MRFERGLAPFAGIIVAVAIVLALPSTPEAQVIAPSRRTTIGLMAGWHIPAGGVFDDHYNTGFSVSGSLKRLVTPNILSGLEIGYTSHGLDSEAFQSQYPQYGVSGGDLTVLPIVAVGDFFLGDASARVRPFLTAGLGAYFLFTDNIQLTGPSSFSVDTYSDSANFGMFGGAGIYIPRSETWGVRVDASYAYIFRGGEDLGFVPVRVGIHWTPVF